uniref:uncharacterized protein LOC122761805 isoform X3 n=1 Tax=Solea senegalensis TaxID=28829 RepID=UPI001CD8F1F4|nr:uncharacterized protein LOC122761805 isoform X3 [Solea senegalensis]
MTAGDPEDTGTCERRTGGQRGEGEDNMKCPPSFTTISTIAIQAGQSQLVVSVLQSGSLVHLQLVQVQPSLCEVGSDQEENRTLIQELQQLKDKLEKHEREVLAAVENGRQTEQRRRKEKQAQEVHKAMEASVSEGWSLLLRLLHRRQEVLLLASDFYCRALEFVVSMDRAEKLHISTDSHRLTCATMRRGLLDKSLTVLSSSSVLLQKLRLLQRAEALHRRGTVLQDDDWEHEHQSSQGSWGAVLKLEELLETLQDRRRTVDQALRLKLQQLENQVLKKDHKSRPEVWTPILDQNLPPESTSFKSADLQSDSKTEKPRDLESGSRADVRPGPIVEKTTVKNHVKSGSRSQQTRIRNPEFRTEENNDLNPESRTDVPSGLKADLQPKSGSRLENFRNLQSRFRLDVNSDSKLLQTCDGQSESISGLRPGSRSQEISYVQPESSSDVKSKSRSQESRNMQTESRLNQKPTSWKGKDLQSESGLEESLELHLGSESDTDPESKSDLDETSPSRSISALMPGSRPHETSYVQPESTSDMKSESRSGESTNMHAESRLDQIPTSEKNKDLQSESRSQTKEIHVQPGSRSERIRKLQSRFRLNQTAGLMPGFRPHETSYPKPESTSDMKSESGTEQSRNMEPESRLEQMPILRTQQTTYVESGSRPQQIRSLESGSSSDPIPRSISEKNKDQESESSSEEIVEILFCGDPPESRSDTKPGSVSGKIRNLLSGSRSDLQTSEESRPRSEGTMELQFKSKLAKSKDLASETDLKPGSGSDRTTRLQVQETFDEGNHAHNVLPANQQQLLSSCELLMDKSARHDVENLKQVLDQIGALPIDVSCRTGPCLHSESCRPLSVLKTLTHQLKRCGTAQPAAASTGSLSPELAARVDVVLKELQSLNLKIKSNLQLLQPYVSFLRTVQQVEEQMEELRGSSRRRSGEEEENIESANSSWPPLKKKEEQEEKEQVDICWQDMLQKLLTTQELGKNYVQTIVMVLGSGLDLQSLVSVVQQTIEKLSRTEQEVKELWSQQRVQIHHHQGDMKSYRRFQDRLLKLRDSFKELKKKFSNLKFNYLKRNDRGRNLKVARNQRQQVEMYEYKLQVLRKRLQGVIARLGSEVKEGGVARETENALNQLERQMVEFERSVREHQKTLDMSCRLQEAMEEYQFWCEDASATIARVSKFSCECCSTDAVAVLHRQFEKFVWPTVPQQEERIVQITELAVRLHGGWQQTHGADF